MRSRAPLPQAAFALQDQLELAEFVAELRDLEVPNAHTVQNYRGRLQCDLAGSEMESGLLYTFSTIAQALGGAFALLAAFVLFRFQYMKSSMWQDSGTVRDALTRGGADLLNYDTLRAQGKYADLIKVIDKIIPRTGTADHLFKDTQIQELILVCGRTFNYTRPSQKRSDLRHSQRAG